MTYFRLITSLLRSLLKYFHQLISSFIILLSLYANLQTLIYHHSITTLFHKTLIIRSIVSRFHSWLLLFLSYVSHHRLPASTSSVIEKKLNNELLKLYDWSYWFVQRLYDNKILTIFGPLPLKFLCYIMSVDNLAFIICPLLPSIR